MTDKALCDAKKRRFWFFTSLWCVGVVGVGCITKCWIEANATSGTVVNPILIFIVCVGWWMLGAACVFIDNYRRGIACGCALETAPAVHSKPVARQHFWNKFLDFRGRASRREFWMELLTYGVLIWALMAGIMTLWRNGTLAVIACLVFLIPLWALFVRRFHDVGCSGWWTVIPCVGAVTCVVSWFVAIFTGYELFLANIGTDIWGILIYVLTAVFVGVLPSRR